MDNEQALAEPVPREVPAMLTVSENCYHVVPGEQPVQVGRPFSRELRSDEQLYERRCTVGEQWTALDLGWLTSVGMILIENQEGRWVQRKPTPQQQADAESKVLEVTWAPKTLTQFDPPTVPRMYVPAAESIRFMTDDPRSLVVRSRSGQCRYVVYLWPE